MIRDIRTTADPEVVVAHGPLYDLEKVLDAAADLLADFSVAMRHVYPETVPEARLWGEEWGPFDGSTLLRMRTAFTLLKSSKDGYDAGSMEFCLRIRPFRIQAGLLGRHGIYRRPGGAYETIDGLPAEEYDPAPEIVVASMSHRAGFLSAYEASVALIALEPHFRKGIGRAGPIHDGTDTTHLFLRFSHEAFGAGEGEMRIDCTDTE